jgi:hypothetical protein
MFYFTHVAQDINPRFPSFYFENHRSPSVRWTHFLKVKTKNKINDLKLLNLSIDCFKRKTVHVNVFYFSKKSPASEGMEAGRIIGYFIKMISVCY